MRRSGVLALLAVAGLAVLLMAPRTCDESCSASPPGFDDGCTRTCQTVLGYEAPAPGWLLLTLAGLSIALGLLATRTATPARGHQR